MRTITGTVGLSPERFRRPVATIGVFDGIHRGHRAVLARTREMAARIGGEVVVLTFHVHPRAVTTGQAPPLVTSLPHRLHLLARGDIGPPEPHGIAQAPGQFLALVFPEVGNDDARAFLDEQLDHPAP